MFGTKADDVNSWSLSLCKVFKEWDKQDGVLSFMDSKILSITSEMNDLNNDCRTNLGQCSTCSRHLHLQWWKFYTASVFVMTLTINRGIGGKYAKEN